MNKQRWYRWHSLAGLPLAVLLCFIMLTGTLAVMSHELDWLTNPAVRAQPSNTPLNWPHYYRAALSSSDGNRIYQLAAPIHNGFAADALLYDENDQRYHAYIDPVTYAHTGNGTWFNWQTLLRRIHRHLMMPLNIGLPIVSLTAFPLLFSLVSGLILHPKWWKGLWRMPRKQNSRVFWGDFHRFSGLWSSWLLVVISITGIWYFAEKYGWGGYWSKALYFFFGLLLTSLSVTGTIIYAHRVMKWRRNETPGLLSVIGIGFRGSRKTGLLSAVLLLICLALTLETLLA